MKPWYLHKPPPSPQKPIQMRPQVPPSNPEKTYRLNAHAQRHGRLGLRFQRLSGGPAASSKSLGGAPTIKDPQRLLLAPTPVSPSPHSSAQQQRSALPVATPALCAVLLCRAVSTKARRARAQRNKRHTHRRVVFIFSYKQPHKRRKQTQSAKSHTRPLSIAPLDPAVAVAAPSRKYALVRVPRAADLAPAPRHPLLSRLLLLLSAAR